jgi:hypothetical protein
MDEETASSIGCDSIREEIQETKEEYQRKVQVRIS